MAQATTTHATAGAVLNDTLRDIAAATGRFDPLGIVTGFRIYRVYTYLSQRSDVELHEMGIARDDIPQVAMKMVRAD